MAHSRHSFLRSEIELSEEECRSLENGPVLLGPIQQGKRKVRAALYNLVAQASAAGPEVLGGLLDPGASATYHYRQSDMSTAILEIPAHLDSVATLEYMGYEPGTAEKTFKRYMSRLDHPNGHENPETLLDYAIADVLGAYSRLNTKRQYTDQALITSIGLTRRMQNAILDPRCKQIRGTQSLVYWIKDTFKLNYYDVEYKNARLRQYVRTHPSKTSSGLSDDELKSTSGVFETCDDTYLPARWVDEQPESAVKPGHIALYKSISAQEIKLPCYGVLVDEEGRISMRSLATMDGDFKSDGSALYLTDRDVAEQYRTYTELRCPFGQTWLIRVEVPKQFMDNLSTKSLFYSPRWKEYVWHCRRGAWRVPAWYHEYDDCDLMVGHISTSKDVRIPRVPEQDVQMTMTEDFTLRHRTDDEKAVQYCFKNLQAADRLQDVIRGKMHIEITGPGGLPARSEDSSDHAAILRRLSLVSGHLEPGVPSDGGLADQLERW